MRSLVQTFQLSVLISRPSQDFALAQGPFKERKKILLGSFSHNCSPPCRSCQWFHTRADSSECWAFLILRKRNVVSLQMRGCRSFLLHLSSSEDPTKPCWCLPPQIKCLFSLHEREKERRRPGSQEGPRAWAGRTAISGRGLWEEHWTNSPRTTLGSLHGSLETQLSPIPICRASKVKRDRPYSAASDADGLRSTWRCRRSRDWLWLFPSRYNHGPLSSSIFFPRSKIAQAVHKFLSLSHAYYAHTHTMLTKLISDTSIVWPLCTVTPAAILKKTTIGTTLWSPKNPCKSISVTSGSSYWQWPQDNFALDS